MKKYAILLTVALGLTSLAHADNEFLGGNGTPTNIWSEPTNWQDGAPPSSATDVGMNDTNVAVIVGDGIEMLIDDSVDAVAFGLQIGKQANPPLGTGSVSSNTLTMTGGTLTQQGNFLFNVGRGRNFVAGQQVTFDMSGGLVNSSGITVPEQFSVEPGNMPINASMFVSGDSVVNTDLLRLGAANANSTVVLSDNAQVNLTDDNMGFAPGALWIEAFEFTPGDISTVEGTSLLDIRDNAVLTVAGEWWTDENGNGNRDGATASEAQYFVDNYVGNGWIVADGGAGVVDVSFAPFGDGSGEGIITISAVPEPTGLIMLVMALPLVGRLRRK